MKCLRLWLVLVLFSSITSSCSSSNPNQPPLRESQITLKGQALEELIAESGISSDDIVEDVTYDHYPYSPTSGEVRVIQVCLGRRMTAKEVRGYLDRKGLKGADIGQLLAYYLRNAKTVPFTLVALGSVWRDSNNLLNCPYVRDPSSIFNNLAVIRCGDDARYYASTCFLAVPKS